MAVTMGWITLIATLFLLIVCSPLSHTPEMELVLEPNQKTKIWGPDLIVTAVQDKIKSMFLTLNTLKSFYLPLVVPIAS